MKNQSFKIGNDYIEREIIISDGVPQKSIIINKKTGAKWETSGEKPLIELRGIDFDGCNAMLCKDKIVFTKHNLTIVWEHSVCDNLPIIKSRIGVMGKPIEVHAENTSLGGDGVEGVEVKNSGRDYIECVGNKGNHVNVTVLNFYDRTDYTDHLVDRKTVPLYNRWGIGEFDGQVFALTERLTKAELLIVKEAPSTVAHFSKTCPDLVSEPIDNIHIGASGIDLSKISEDEFTYTYPVAIGVSQDNEWEQLFRDYYNSVYKVKRTYTMSNTWGDRNQDMRVSESFILKEIDRAKELGIDIVQIDDGWQTGITANSGLSDGGCWTGGYRDACPDFWCVNKAKFPNGLGKVVDYAKENGIEIGLWFSPDGVRDYADWELDADTLFGFYDTYGIKYFKLDGIKVNNRTAEKNILNMLSYVVEKSNGNVIFNMDITNGKRFGYLMHREFGDLFVENRYTDIGNYYPYRTMKNLWDLSRYFPASRMQMEVLNLRRNKDKYDDILAPDNYDIDFVFASVMVANPLLWMELQGLDDDSRQKLSKIIDVYKKYRDDFISVIPILDEPDGFSITGFKILGKANNYLILIRDQGECDTADIAVKEVLATNDDNIELEPIRFSGKKKYLFAVTD